MRILLIQTAFLGDLILATALLESLHQGYPEARIDLLLRKGFESLFAGHPFLGKLHSFDKQNKWSSLRRLSKQLRQENYDLVINLQRFASSGFLALSTGAKEVVGFDKNPLSWFYSKRYPHHIAFAGQKNYLHEVERNYSLLQERPELPFCKPRLYPSEADFAAVPQGEYYCFAPKSVWATKEYPEEAWISLILALRSEREIILLGGPGDAEACERIAQACAGRSVKNMAGKLSFLASAAYMAKAKHNVVNDSGPLHLASALNAPVTALFCSTLPSFGFGPLSERSFVVEYRGKLPCRPCGLHGRKSCPEGHFRCGRGIEQAEIRASMGD